MLLNGMNDVNGFGRT